MAFFRKSSPFALACVVVCVIISVSERYRRKNHEMTENKTFTVELTENEIKKLMKVICAEVGGCDTKITKENSELFDVFEKLGREYYKDF